METKKREFIDPNDLMKYIEENHCYAGLPMTAHICTMELLTYAPRVDAVEVVHGRWIRKQIGKYTGLDEICCSICDSFIGVVGSDTGFEEAIKGLNFCSNCGAKMEAIK